MQMVLPQDELDPRSFGAALLHLLRHPLTVIRLWNWKAALLSMALRGPVFVAASFRLGIRTAFLALGTELFFCATTAGFYGAVVQALRLAQPQWLTVLFTTVILPGIFQGFEFLLHWTGGTPHLRFAEFVSASISATSALFNWYIMRRNALLVGREGDRFQRDLARLPSLFLSFVTALPRRWLELEKRRIRCGA